MNTQRAFILLLSVLGMSTVFMPWITTPLMSFTVTAGKNYFIIVPFAFLFLITFPDLSTSMTLFGRSLVVIIATLIAIMGFILIKDFNGDKEQLLRMVGNENKFTEAISNTLDNNISVGFGLYLLIGVCILLVIIAFFPDESNQYHSIRANAIKTDVPLSSVNKQSNNSIEDCHQEQIKQIRQLKQLLDTGVISQLEFEHQKLLILTKN